MSILYRVNKDINIAYDTRRFIDFKAINVISTVNEQVRILKIVFKVNFLNAFSEGNSERMQLKTTIL